MSHVPSSPAGLISPDRLKRLPDIAVGQSIVIEEHELEARPMLIEELLWAGRDMSIALTVVKHQTDAGAVYELACSRRKRVRKAFHADALADGDAARDKLLRRTIREYMHAAPDRLRVYGSSPETRAAGLIPKSYMSRRLLGYRVFRCNEVGVRATDALNGSIERLQTVGILGGFCARVAGTKPGYLYSPDKLRNTRDDEV